MTRSSALVGGLLALLTTLGTGHAAAEASASDKASAEALFDEALRAMKEGRFAEACPKLENSQRIDPGVGTLLYLGECYEKLGRTASAWATFREAASEADAGGQTKRAKAARDRYAKLEPQLAYLTIEVAEGTRALPGLRIRRDGADTGLGIIGSAVPADPGPSKIDVTAPDHESFSVTVRVQPNARQTVLIPTLAAVEGPRPVDAAVPLAAAPPPEQKPEQKPPAPPPAAPAADENPGGTQRIIGLVLAGGGLVGVGLGTYFGLRAIDKEKQADKNCSPTLCQEKADFESSDQAHSAATGSTISFVAGGALLAAGAVVFFTAPSKSSSVGLSPVVAPGFAGIRIGGTL